MRFESTYHDRCAEVGAYRHKAYSFNPAASREPAFCEISGHMEVTWIKTKLLRTRAKDRGFEMNEAATFTYLPQNYNALYREQGAISQL